MGPGSVSSYYRISQVYKYALILSWVTSGRVLIKTAAVRLYASQVQLIACAYNDGFSGISNSGDNSDAWILAASVGDLIVASPRSATPLYSGLSAVVSSCFIFLSRLSCPNSPLLNSPPLSDRTLPRLLREYLLL